MSRVLSVITIIPGVDNNNSFNHVENYNNWMFHLKKKDIWAFTYNAMFNVFFGHTAIPLR